MPNKFFATEERCNALSTAARRWLKTPFHPKAGICQIGTDCSHLCAAIFNECGWGEKFEWPKYTMSHGRHGEQSLLRAFFAAHPRFMEVPLRPYCIGNILLINEGAVAHHMGIVISRETFIHAVYRLGVIESRLDDPTFSKKFETAYQPITA